jgi:predicted TIM-barrel fold metal-dependent hydrolase
MSDVEPITDAYLPIVDSHHHLWFMNSAALEDLEARDSIAARALLPVSPDRSRYLFDELMLDVKGGHNVRATVYVDAHSMYRASGPAETRSLGEVELPMVWQQWPPVAPSAMSKRVRRLSAT